MFLKRIDKFGSNSYQAAYVRMATGFSRKVTSW